MAPYPRRYVTSSATDSTMPVALPRKPHGPKPHDELVRVAIREERRAEHLRRLHEFETQSKIRFQHARGMSLASLVRIYGKDTVDRCFEQEKSGVAADG